jgi:ABC-2 type transport system permease protein
VDTFQEAYQLGALVVLPVIGLLVGQATGALLLNLPVVISLGTILWVLNGLLLWAGKRALYRPNLASRI